MTFKPGASGNPGGRKKGALNKTTAMIKTAIEGAFKELGGQKWLVAQAQVKPEAFMALLGKVIPRDLSLEHNVGSTLEELIAASHKPRVGDKSAD